MKTWEWLRRALSSSQPGQGAKRQRDALRQGQLSHGRAISGNYFRKIHSKATSETTITRDLTSEWDYEKLIEEEKEHYSKVEVTGDLKEGGVHAGACWQYYWEAVARVISTSPFSDVAGYLDRTFGSVDRPIRILSLGSGYCGHEIGMALSLPFLHATCWDKIALTYYAVFTIVISRKSKYLLINSMAVMIVI